MDKGNWVPLDKRLVSFLPKIADNRPYTKLEAMFSLSVDYDNSTSVSVAQYSRLWKWNRKTVSRFFQSIDVEIIYPKSTTEKQNQMGQIGIQIRGRSGADQGQIRMIKNKGLEIPEGRSGADQGQIRGRSVSATIYPKPKPKPIKKTIIDKPENVTDQTWSDFLDHRKEKKATVSQTVINTFAKQAELAGMSLEEAMIESMHRGWRGFKAEWMKNKNNQNSEENFLDGIDLNDIGQNSY